MNSCQAHQIYNKIYLAANTALENVCSGSLPFDHDRLLQMIQLLLTEWNRVAFIEDNCTIYRIFSLLVSTTELSDHHFFHYLF